ncbi:unnamed protein product [Linum trigynum]|uniref:Uncharacterized protein n=1 Tax=Linum trigynum TaxID=586398 RepID=A0AAV2EWD1_9ROSI
MDCGPRQQSTPPDPFAAAVGCSEVRILVFLTDPTPNSVPRQRSTPFTVSENCGVSLKLTATVINLWLFPADPAPIILSLSLPPSFPFQTTPPHNFSFSLHSSTLVSF